jgi:hypothetical protein
MDRKMLKEAIADAKTIRETAIASAKSALEEAFAPQLTALFAERLNELELEESEAEKEPETNETYSVEEEIDETFNLEELLAELSMEEEQESTKEGDDMKDESLEENLMLEEMSDEEIEELVMQVIDDMIASGKLMPGEGEEEDEEGEDMEDMDDVEVGDEDEEIDIDEILSEVDSIEESEQLNEFGLGDIPNALEVLDNIINSGLSSEMIAKLAGGLGLAGGGVAFAKAIKDFRDDIKKAKTSKTPPSPEVKETATTTEMEETINELRNELNEVNLLNAKLLYTNKIFKAKNLTESEKIKVLNTFDKAETVKEVKLVFETLTESLKTTAVAKKNPIKESLGSASKTISTATPKQPIIEVNEAFARMQKIAGIRK